ncbi:thioredoxin-disulfide reductase [Fodinicola feengrottensis]|uniref:thioredoxin-disulfide reductase n=1 Tax=Fodinicola feengrottensis TaxID=435914 RepID=UPI0036F2D1C7
MSERRTVIIVGSGPAGYTAAIYTARANLSPLVIEGANYGGALMTTTEVENFPGYPEGVQGPDMMEQLRQQAERFGAEFISDDASSVDLSGDLKKVTVGDQTYEAPAVILATVRSAWRPLGVRGEQEFLGRGVSSCATCDGFFFKGQNIAVIGGGDSAMEEATFLTRFAETVTIVHRRDEFRASKIMADRALGNDKIKVKWNSAVSEVLGTDGKVSALKLTDTVTGAESTLDVTGVFIAIGHDPRSELYRGQVDLDENGYVLVDSPSTRTNLTGVFAAGDLVDHTYQQAITAAGSGCVAALDAERFLEGLSDSEEPLGATWGPTREVPVTAQS